MRTTDCCFGRKHPDQEHDEGLHARSRCDATLECAEPRQATERQNEDQQGTMPKILALDQNPRRISNGLGNVCFPDLPNSGSSFGTLEAEEPRRDG